MKKYLLVFAVLFGSSCDENEGSNSLGSWRRLSDYPADARNYGVAFSVNGKGYWAFGAKATGYVAEVWQFDPARDEWEQKNNFPYESESSHGPIANSATVVHDKALVLMTSGLLYEYDPAIDEWSYRSSFPAGSPLSEVSFTLGDNAYFATQRPPYPGTSGPDPLSFWKYNTKSNSWTEIADFPGPARRNAFSLVIGNHAYVGGGYGSQGNASNYVDSYRYDDRDDTWYPAADLPHHAAQSLVSASNSRGYVGVLFDNNTINAHIFEYNPDRDQWRNMSKFPSGESVFTESFFLDDRIFYIGMSTTGRQPQVWEFVP